MSRAASRDAAPSSRGVACGALAEAPADGPRRTIARRLQIGKSFWRYGVVGILSNAVGYSAYLLITWLGAGPKTSMTSLYAASVLLGFIGNRIWAFQ